MRHIGGADSVKDIQTLWLSIQDGCTSSCHLIAPTARKSPISAIVIAEIYPKDTYNLKEILPTVLSEMCLNGFVLPHSCLNPTFYSQQFQVFFFFFTTLQPVLFESSVIIIPTGRKMRREFVFILDLFGELASFPQGNCGNFTATFCNLGGKPAANCPFLVLNHSFQLYSSLKLRFQHDSCCFSTNNLNLDTKIFTVQVFSLM